MPVALDIERLIDLQENGGWRAVPAVVNDIQAALDLAPPPTPRGFADAARLVITAIHALPQLYRGRLGLQHFEVYLGRCGATPGHVYSRFSSHHGKRGHEAGMVLMERSNVDITRWEGAALTFVTGLMKRRSLCVANLTPSGGGRLPEGVASSYIYLTWRLQDGPQSARVPTDRDITALVPAVSAALGQRSSPTLESALKLVRQPKEAVAPNIGWAPGHA